MSAIWEYTDRTGVIRRGHFVRHSDFGGTDVTYTFHRHDENGKPITTATGRIVDLVSGQRLKLARRIWS